MNTRNQSKKKSRILLALVVAVAGCAASASFADGPQPVTPSSGNTGSSDLSPGWHQKVISSKIVAVGDCQCDDSCGLFGRSSYQLNWIEKQQVLKYLVDSTGRVVSSSMTSADVNQQNAFTTYDWSPSYDTHGACEANKNALKMRQSAEAGDVPGAVQSLNQTLDQHGEISSQAVDDGHMQKNDPVYSDATTLNANLTAGAIR
jgi:opacity protein-like surface antigen